MIIVALTFKLDFTVNIKTASNKFNWSTNFFEPCQKGSFSHPPWTLSNLHRLGTESYLFINRSFCHFFSSNIFLIGVNAFCIYLHIPVDPKTYALNTGVVNFILPCCVFVHFLRYSLTLEPCSVHLLYREKKYEKNIIKIFRIFINLTTSLTYVYLQFVGGLSVDVFCRPVYVCIEV